MDPLFRILDANLNRAREGLRVIEDAARFALADASLTADLKLIRHALRAAADAVDPGRLRLLAARDTASDVGSRITTPTETHRTSLHDLVAAAASRAAEALRVIEETVKVLAPPAAAGVEHARYRLYDLEKRLTLALGTGRARQWRLCVLITESLCTHHAWLEVARRAIDGGADCLQLREKTLDSAEFLARAQHLVDLARSRGVGVSVIINDRADIALAVGADGVHLGQSDLPVSAIRRLAGSRLLVGVSTHNLDEARRALEDGADYAGVGAMFPTATKPRETSGPAYLRAFLEFVKDKRPLPHLAIGGITPANLPQLREAGCRGVAVSSVVCSSPDPAKVCAEICASLPAPRSP